MCAIDKLPHFSASEFRRGLVSVRRSVLSKPLLRPDEFLRGIVPDWPCPSSHVSVPVSVPCGLDSNGLPIGFQIQGRPFAEARVLKIADAYQRDTDWHRRLPPNVS